MRSKEITIKPVTNLEDAMHLRDVRNSCRMFMTHHQAIITKKQQEKWFESLDQTKYTPYLVLYGDEVAGFCVIATQLVNNKTEYWLTGGLYENYRGLGIGRFIFSWMISECKRKWRAGSYDKTEIWLDVLATNDKARCLYESLGFLTIKRDDNLVVMKRGIISLIEPFSFETLKDVFKMLQPYRVF